ncbi:MAG: helix-turn-helix domain-containing protein [Chloroflexota bacterium]|nr:helix-turn-helix domain-containing protein [Chloroflexota bacterium]
MSTLTVEGQNIQPYWAKISPLLSIRNAHEYDGAIERLNHLLDQIGTDENHSLYGLLDTLGTLIHAYEREHYPMPEASGVDMIHFFMEEHGLTQRQLPELRSQGVVSEILNGKRALNLRQIRALAERFQVSPDVFI